MGLALMAGVSAFTCFLIISVMSFFIMALSTIFSITMLAFVQEHTPPYILGKVDYVARNAFIAAGAGDLRTAVSTASFCRMEYFPRLRTFIMLNGNVPQSRV